MPTATKKSTKTASRKTARKPVAAPPTFAEVMSELEQAGSEQTRKTYARHGVVQPMFGVSFASLKALTKRIGVDHDMALALWDTGNFDARNLAVKIVDPAQMSMAQLDAWALDPGARMCNGYVAHVALEGPHAKTCVKRWLSSANETKRCVGWGLVCAFAMRDATMDDAWFAGQLGEIESTIHKAPNAEREAMNHALIAIGSRSASLRKAAIAAAQRIGKVEVDHGDTACKTPDAAAYIEKVWGHSRAKGFDSPAAQERNRESMRTRC